MDPQTNVPLRSGNAMPAFGLGTSQLTHDTAGTVETAVRLGYQMIDTSGDYGTQPGIGRALEREGISRDDVYIVTKVEETNNAYQATRKNLDELGIDFANLVLIHRPPENGAGEELWRGLMKAKEEGLARDIGVSNYPQHLLDALIEVTGETPVANRIEWSPFGHSEDMLNYAREYDIVIQAYSPLTRTTRLDDGKLSEIAQTYRKSPAQVLIRWNLQLGTIPLPKANQREHLEDDIDVFDFRISDEHMEALNSFNERYSSLGALPYD